MDNEEVSQYFKSLLTDDPTMSEAVAAIKTLIRFIEKKSGDGTLSGLHEEIKGVIAILKNNHTMVTSISSGCSLFFRFITLTNKALDTRDFQALKQILVERGNVFLSRLYTSRAKIARLANPFIRDGATILTHSRSRVVLQVLTEAMKAKKHFTVYVTESMPDRTGQKMYDDLRAVGVPAILILDAAVGYIMEKVDLVLVGAEGVVENGGIINKIGTYTLATCAREMNRPFYVVAESFKFTRHYPLNQQDIPIEFKFEASKVNGNEDLSREHPMVDYTPPAYLSLLFTDLGVLTPSAVSDELIKLYL